MADEFYIATTKHGFVGNATTFWAPNSSGYVTDVERAGKYSLLQATSICEPSGGEAMMIRCELVEDHKRTYLHADDMRRLATMTKEEANA